MPSVRRPLTLLCLTGALLALPVATTAQASPLGKTGNLGVRGMTESQLRSYETSVLGAEHAAEHAAERRFLRTKRGKQLLKTRNAAERRSASRARAAAVCDPATSATQGCWSESPFALPVMAINAALLPTGKVLIYAYPQNPSWGPDSRNAVNKGVAAVIDPNTKQTVATRDMPNIWCSGTSFLPDGRVLVTGGTLAYTSYPRTWKGLNQTWTYNAFTNQWTQHANMRHGRWYPTQVQLPDGRSLITSGLDESGDANGQADAPLNKDVELFNPADGSVSLASGPDTPLQGMYPHMWQMPSGRILVTGPYAKDTFYLQLTGATSYSVADAPNTAQQHYWGAGVLDPSDPTRVIQIGGSNRISNEDDLRSSRVTDGARTTVESLDEDGGGWRAEPALNVRRAHLNTVLTPDGGMITVGGGKGMVKRANPRNGGAEDEFNYDAFDDQRRVELWNPATRQWSLGAAQVEYRTYHSTALLLPDGRILSAGDDFNTSSGDGTNSDTAEIYSPPYLFKGARPTIAGVTAGVNGNGAPVVRPGAALGVQSPDADIASASLVSLGATTHANDMNQRYVQLGLQRSSGGVNVTLPPANYVPAGYYMLFLVNSKGVPSVARVVQVDPNAPAPATLRAAPGTQPSTPGGGSSGSGSGTGTTPPGGSTDTTSALVRLGGWESGKLSPWKRSAGSARVTTGGKSGKRALSLAGTSRRAGKVARTLPRLATGSYTLRLWVRGRVSVRLSPGGKTLAAASRTSRTWRRVALKVEVTSATRSSLTITVAKGRSARVDDVRLTR